MLDLDRQESLHQLAVVLFSDIAGYTALMGADHKKAMKLVNKARILHQALADKYHGRLIKQLGDGFLITFASALDAGAFAVDLMGASKKQEFNLRIGIHLGEVMYSDGDIYGDGVNIASRLQSKAEISQILISDSFYQNIKNDDQLISEFHGEFQFKNVPDKMKVYELGSQDLEMHPHQPKYLRNKILLSTIAVLGLVMGLFFSYPWIRTAIFSPNEEFAIAILSLQTPGSDPRQEYFAEGMANEIRSKLISVKGFTVRSPQSTRYITNQHLSTKQVGKELNVTHILDGSIQLLDDQVRFNLFLTDVNTDESIPISLKDYSAEDLYAAQTDIAMQVVRNLNLNVSSKEQKRINRKPTENLQAHQAYLLGLYKLERGTYRTPLLEAEEYFKQAVREDPEFPEAYVGLVEAYFKMHQFGYMTRDSALALAVRLIQKVSTIDPESSALHNSKGLYYLYSLRPQLALEELNMASISDPEDYRPHYSRWLLYYIYNQIDQAFQELEIASKLNPLSGLIHSEYTIMEALRAGDISALDQYVEGHPDDTYLSWSLGMQYAIKGDFEKALYHLTNRGLDSLKMNWMIGYVYAAIGETEKALRVAAFLEEKYQAQYLPPSIIGIIYAGLQDEKNKLKWMKEAQRVRDSWPSYVDIIKLYQQEQWYRDWFDLGTIDRPRDPWADQQLFEAL